MGGGILMAHKSRPFNAHPRNAPTPPPIRCTLFYTAMDYFRPLNHRSLTTFKLL
ncbi:hypothetical protein BJV78DRAFT_1218968 [Lactifluus subvellereus]|nr:hypothetical protein BJV78DRAFT_1218968 [Lactifluus subvellereus]